MAFIRYYLVTLSAKNSLILGENKAAFRRVIFMPVTKKKEKNINYHFFIFSFFFVTGITKCA